MRVKRLEIQGFKSFKEKTVIHFDHSITGIVGPNGCGKSNIVDAFFWVMGEQSYKHMRGNSSEDLIFNGSSKYSPLGMAEATLVLETGLPHELHDSITDTAHAPAGASVQDISTSLRTREISVTRKLYRSGEGEYFINGNLARLKDIQELFMDTGVGAKGYSVIEQGQIGKIVNAKPEERRLLIEEAAGIAKYKARKKESLRKMEATQANLSRLTDIIQEIEKNLGSLERQAQKAQLYKKYKGELLDKEMTWGRRKFYVMNEKLGALKAQKDALEQELILLKSELQISENSIEVDRIDLVTENKEAETLQLQIQDIADRLSQEKSALELSRRRQGDLASQKLSLETEREELQASITSNTERLSEIEDQAQEAEALFQNMAHEASEKNADLCALRQGVDQARTQLDATQREMMSGVKQMSDITSKIAGLLSKADAARSQSEKLSQQAETQSLKIQTVGEELQKIHTTLEKMKQQREEVQSSLKEKNLQLRSGEQEVKELEKQKNDSLRSLTQVKSKLQSLEELDESHEGLADGPKAALDWAKENKYHDQIHALTDILEVSQGYESLLQGWLENRIENLITQDPSLALTLLDQIKTGKLGRVNIQLTSAVGPSKKSDTPASSKAMKTLLENHGFHVLGELSKFVTANAPTSQSVLNILIGNVMVVESATPFPEFFQSEEFQKFSGWSMVSQDGIAVESHGLIRGGSLETSGAVSAIKRKRQIEELKAQVGEAEIKHQELEETFYQSKENLELLRAQVQTSQQEIQTLEVQFAGSQRDAHQTQRALQEAQSHLDSLLKDCQELNLQAERAAQEKETTEARLAELTNKRDSLEESISEAEGTLLERESVLRSQEEDLGTVRIKEASLRERAVSLKRELEGIQSLISDRQKRLSDIGRTLERALREHEHYTGGESELAEKIEVFTLSLANTREKLAAVKDQIEQSNAKVNLSLERVKVLHKQGDQKTSESTHLALEVEKLSGEISHLVLNLEEKYGPGCLNGETLTPAASIGEMAPEEELLLTEEVERLRERIRRLGEVNVMAIEEFEQLKTRYDHLLIERTDLEHSLSNLRDAIEHINKTSEDRFQKAFEAIAERFERLFPLVFGGGQAKMSLVYPEGSKDILEAGVDILAQPPGKKIANMTLLSGGEKALTAVSLIFAIFMVKPSPFCVLDEVDAPLDDANIGKFNALLREMSAKSQFILITHNKKTMELNDTLYGVTMEEPGVSKMVSIEMA